MRPGSNKQEKQRKKSMGGDTPIARATARRLIRLSAAGILFCIGAAACATPFTAPPRDVVAISPPVLTPPERLLEEGRKEDAGENCKAAMLAASAKPVFPMKPSQ